MNSCIDHNLRTFEGGIPGNGSKEDSDSDDEEVLTKRLVRQASNKIDDEEALTKRLVRQASKKIDDEEALTKRLVRQASKKIDDEEALTKRLVRQASKKNFMLFLSPLYQAWCVYYYRYKVQLQS